MPVEAATSWQITGSFALLLARLAGAITFVPIPGIRNALDPARVVLTICLTSAMFPLRPVVQNLPSTAGGFALWMAGEACFGIAVGLVVGLVSEGLLVAIQMISMQAGFSFATTFDPASQADSGVLQILATLASNLLFFALGLHHLVLRAFAATLDRWPAGSAWHGTEVAGMIIRFGSTVLELGLRLAIPVAGVLFLSDLFLALAGRLHAHLQLLSLSFPIKMLAALAALAAMTPVFVSIYSNSASKAARVIEGAIR